MKPHLDYFHYLIKHKFYVFQECRKLKLSIWTALIHDWHKFTPTEWKPHVQFFAVDGEERPPSLKESFNKAWLHHIHLGSHHWEHWILVNKSPESHFQALEIPDRFRREMLADWHGAGRAIHGYNNTKEYYLNHKDSIILHPNTRAWVERQLGIS